MNDYAAQNMKQADYASAVGGQIASARSQLGPRPAMASLGSILDRSRKLAEMANDLANRIGGPVPMLDGLAASVGGPENDPLSNLASATAAVDKALDRAEQNLARALNGL
jgi:hypothetical protein